MLKAFRGFTLSELLIAVAILAVVLTGSTLTSEECEKKNNTIDYE